MNSELSAERKISCSYSDLFLQKNLRNKNWKKAHRLCRPIGGPVEGLLLMSATPAEHNVRQHLAGYRVEINRKNQLTTTASL